MVYGKIGLELPDDWVAIHSLGLPGHEKKIWGEADIVVISKFGIFSLEVKGGKVSCRDGVWTFQGGGFKSYTKKEDPWTQSKTAMMAVRTALHNADAAFKNTLFGYGVVMPYTRFDTSGAEFLPEVLNDRLTIRQGMDQYIGRLHRYWDSEYRRKHGREYTGLSAGMILKARQVLRPDLETTLSLGGWLTGVEAELLHLTNTQIRISRRLAANPRSIVRGSAGTGKSVLALDRARHLAEDGRRVLYLCFNRLLAAHVQRSLGGETESSLTAWHAHGLYAHLIARAGLSAKLEGADSEDPSFYPLTLPELAIDAILSGDFEPYDAIVIDEAQDLLSAVHLDVFDLLLAQGLDNGCWHVFLDPKQNLYPSEIQEAAEQRLMSGYPVLDRLEENCRNTRQVAAQASIISGIDLAITGALSGPECENVVYTGSRDGREKLETLIAEMFDGDVRPADLVILSTRRFENSLIAGMDSIAGRQVFDLGSGRVPSARDIAFSTMHGFKGLERNVVIAIDMAEIGDDQRSMLHYAGLSRAKSLLRTFIPQASLRRYDRQAERYGARIADR
tara:strand:+ start:19072 stop:20754 length:1683 start_codon:yes stop_codon:yes gene_type:complete